MTYRNPDLYETSKKFAQSSWNFLASKIENYPHDIQYEQRWIRSSGDVFTLDYHHGKISAAVYFNELKELLEYKNCEKVLHADPVISKQLNSLVGSSRSKVRVTPEGIIVELLTLLVEQGESQEFPENLYNEVYSTFEDALYQETIIVKTIVPLGGFSGAVPIVLGDTLSIERLTDDEIVNCLDMGLNIGMKEWKGRIYDVPAYGIIQKQSERKLIGEEKAKQAPNPLIDIDKVITALRLFKKGEFYTSGSITMNENIFQKSMSGGFIPDTRYQYNLRWDYNLNQDEVKIFSELFNTMTSEIVQERKFLQVALRRFRYAAEKSIIDDKIIDLLISAEALFLSGQKGPTELRYKLAQRAAIYIAKDPEARYEVFKNMQKAYDARSALVHGATPKTIKDAKGKKMSLGSSVLMINEYIRDALKKAIMSVKVDDQQDALMDWDQEVIKGYVP